MSESALVAVFNAPDEIQALLYRTVLEEAGIDVVERTYEITLFESVRQNALHSELLVRAEDADRARALLAAFYQEAATGELALDNAEEPPEGTR